MAHRQVPMANLGRGLNVKRWMLAAVCIGLLSGCVTQTESIFTQKENKAQAVKDYVDMGAMYFQQGSYDLARARLKRALNLEPDNAQALATLGLVYQAQHEPDLAEQNFRKALDEKPDYTRGRTFYGAFLYSQGRYGDAYKQFLRASKDPDYNDRELVFVNLAESARRIGKNDEALKAFRRALELAPGDHRALAGISGLLVHMGRYRQAQYYYSQLLTKINQTKGLQHSPQTLWTGILIARHFGNADQESSLALLLRNLYPKSQEFKQYKALTSNE